MLFRNFSARIAATIVALACLTVACLAGPQSSVILVTTQIHHHKNFLQRHPTLSGVAAGMATHHALKVAARRDKRMGKKLNWAERHPTLTSVGVGAATHHVLKHSHH